MSLLLDILQTSNPTAPAPLAVDESDEPTANKRESKTKIIEQSTITNGVDLFRLPKPLLTITTPQTTPRLPIPNWRTNLQRWLFGGGIVILYGVTLGGFVVYSLFSEERPPVAYTTQNSPSQPQPIVIARHQPTPTPPLVLTKSTPLTHKQAKLTPIASQPEPVSPPLAVKTKPESVSPPLAMTTKQLTEPPPSVAQSDQSPPNLGRYLFLSDQPNPLYLAHKAFLAGDLTTAKRFFMQILERDPNNLAAMTGLAAIALRLNQTAEARTLYQTILQTNPDNTLATAALSSLNEPLNPSAINRQLTGFLNQTPNAIHLHFALGTLYARQKNWPAAQIRFLTALQHDGNNPDILFNLAVCLDQQGAHNNALHYYREAIQVMTQQGGAGFDAAEVEKRIAVLSQRHHAT